MKASKLVLTIFLSIIFSLVLCLCFFMLSTNHDRGTVGELHYIPFENSFRHLVVEDGWILSADFSEAPDFSSLMKRFNGDKIREMKAEMTPNGMLMLEYFFGYDDEELLSRIEVKNDTLFFRKLKLASPFKRTMRLNLSGLSSVGISGSSSVAFKAERDYTSEIPFNLGEFTMRLKDEAIASTDMLSFDRLNLKAEDHSTATLLRVYPRSDFDGKEKNLISDLELSGNAVLKIYNSELRLTDYEIKDEAALIFPQKFIETAYGKKLSRYVVESSKKTNASSSSN